MLYTALIGYIYYEGSGEEEQNFDHPAGTSERNAKPVRMMRRYKNPVDLLFEELEAERPGALCGADSIKNISWRPVIYALSDFLIMILSWLVKQSLRAFLFQEVQP